MPDNEDDNHNYVEFTPITSHFQVTLENIMTKLTISVALENIMTKLTLSVALEDIMRN